VLPCVPDKETSPLRLIGSPRAQEDRPRLGRALCVAFLITLVVSSSCYVANRRDFVPHLRQGIRVVASSLTSVPRLNLAQELPAPSLGLLIFLASCIALFLFIATRLPDLPPSVQVTAAILACLSYAIVVHEALDVLSMIWISLHISDTSLGLAGLATLVLLMSAWIFKPPVRRGPRTRCNASMTGTPKANQGELGRSFWPQLTMLHWRNLVLGACVLAAALSYWFAVKAAVSNPPAGWDGLWYHLPVAIAATQFGTLREFWLGGISSTPITLHASNPAYAYPAAGSILYSLNLRAGADRWSFLWQMLGVCLLFAATHILSRALGASKRLGLVVSVACILVPIVVMQSTTVMVDNLSAGFGSSSCALLVFLLRARLPSQRRRELFVVSGLASGLAVATKSTALPTALLCLLTASVVSYSTQSEPRRLRELATEISLFCAGLLAVGAYWYVRNWILLENPVYPFRLGLGGLTVFEGLDARTFWAAKEFQFVQTRADWLSILWHDPTWSYEAGTGPVGAMLFPAIAFAALYGVCGGCDKQKIGTYLVLSMAILSIGAWWVFTQHEPRYLITILPLCFSLLGMVWNGCQKRSQQAIGVLLSSILMCTAFMLAQAFAPSISPVYDRARQYSWATGTMGGVSDWVDRLPEGTIILNDGQGDTGWVTMASNYPLAGLGHTNVVLTDPHLVVCESEALSLQRLNDAGVSLIYRRVEANTAPRCYESWAQIRKALEETSNGYAVKVLRVGAN
jgi:hypothetical protein